MTTYYVDLVNGNDVNAGTSWGTAKKTFSTVGSSGDTILIANRGEYTLPSVSFVNGSSTAFVSGASVTKVFDEDNLASVNITSGLAGCTRTAHLYTGKTLINVLPQYVNANNRLVANGMLDVTTNNNNNAYSVPSTANGKRWLVLKAKRRYASFGASSTRYGVSFNGNADGTGGVGSNASELVYATTTASTTTRSVSYGCALWGDGAYETMGVPTYSSGLQTNDEYIWFAIPTSVTSISTITLFSNDTVSNAFSTAYISACFIVGGMPNWASIGWNIDEQNNGIGASTLLTVNGCTRQKNGYLNHYVACANKALPMKHVLGWGVDKLNGTYTLSALLHTAWNSADTTSAGTLKMGDTFAASPTLTFGAGKTYIFGVDTTTNQQVSCDVRGAMSTSNLYTTISPGNGCNVSGLGFYHSTRGAVVNLTSTMSDVNLTFDGFESNAVALDLTTDGTCPTRVFIHYKTMGPNTIDMQTATALNSCSNWSIAPTKSFSSSAVSSIASYVSGPVRLTFSVLNFLGWSMWFTRPRDGAFTVSMSGSVASTPMSRNRGFTFNASETSAVSQALSKATKTTFSVVGGAFSSFSSAAKRASAFVSSVAVSVGLVRQTDKGVPFTTTVASSSIWSFAPIKQFPWVVSIVSAVNGALNRDRGYSFTSTNDLTFAPSTEAARKVQVTSTQSSSVVLDSLKRIKEVVIDTVLVNSAVATINTFQSKTVRSAVNVVSSVTGSPMVSRVVTVVSNATSGVASAIGRSRAGQMVVSAAGATFINFTRVKAMAWDVAGSLGVAVPLRKAGRVAFTSTNAVASYFANNLIVSFISSMTTGVSTAFVRKRPAAMTLSSLTTSVFGAKATRGNAFSSSNSTSSSLSLLRNRGYSFTIPMSHTMTANLARLVGESFVSHTSPVISVVFGKEQRPGFTVISQSGNQMLVEVHRAFDLFIGEEVTVDGTLRVQRPVSEAFGSSSGASTEAGVRRGVQFTQSGSSVMSNTASRLVPLAFTMDIGNRVGVSANGNRLDEYYVQFDDVFSSTIADGSIVLGERRVQSSGILQDQHPVFNVTVPTPEVFNITVKEDD